MRWVIGVAFALVSSAADAETMYYGSRAGMEVTVVSKSHLDSTHATIEVKHTKQNAIAFCRDYVLKVTKKCINEEMAVNLLPSISANCKTGKFITLTAEGFRFMGPNPSYDPNDDLTYTEYLLISGRTGQPVGGSMAEGYGVALEQFKALCPNRLK